MGILYKYVTAQIALTCIPEVGDLTLRATQLSALNDPFEGHVNTFATSLGTKAEENSELAKALTDIIESKPRTEEHGDRDRAKYGSLFTS